MANQVVTPEAGRALDADEAFETYQVCRNLADALYGLHWGLKMNADPAFVERQRDTIASLIPAALAALSTEGARGA